MTTSANILQAVEEIRKICESRRIEICGDFAIHEIDEVDETNETRSLGQLRSIDTDGFTQSPRTQP